MAATRPATISELASAAKSDPDTASPSTQPLKYYLRRADTHKRTAKALASGAGLGPTAENPQGTHDTGLDLERAFIEFARAATLIVDTIPNHRDYASELSETQRANLTANGEDTLGVLGRVRQALVERYDRYARSPAASTDARPAFMVYASANPQPKPPQRRASEHVHTAAQRAVADEAARWRAQREQAAARDTAAGFQYPSSASASASTSSMNPSPSSTSPAYTPPTSVPSHPTYRSSASSAAAAAAARSAAVAAATSSTSMPMPMPVSLASTAGHPAAASQPAALPPSFGRPAQSVASAYIGNNYPSSAGVSIPQLPPPQPQPPPGYANGGTPGSGSHLATPVSSSSGVVPTPGPMPLRAIHEYDGESTDSEGPRGWRNMGSSAHPGMPFPVPSTADDLSYSMARMSTAESGSTSRIDGLPSPSHLAVSYPSLTRHMSTHQRTQGYIPGAWGSTLGPAVPAIPGASSGLAGVGSTGWGAAQALEAAHAAAAAPSAAPASYSTSFAPPALPPPLKPPAPAPAPPPQATAPPQSSHELDRAPSGRKQRLRTVVLPQSTLPRFLSIASANTARNLETCGLLLGREVVRGPSDSGKARYVVETLLIPKQHATSDTCTMDEEESVLEFTESRGLITLGWIHTHPSQSCFMSSVDLHTHASFQRMLPESFAVVCAPKSDPTFGIFRLTDPPGLQTVLRCTEKQAFHPHPDVPIYTDADKGHVQMREAQLEIVDLR